MARGNVQDILSGLLFLAIGLIGAVASTAYDIGTARQMGPGYMPVGLFGIMAVIGAIIAIRGGLQQFTPAPTPALRPLLMVLVATGAFAALIRTGGLFLATLVLVVTASFADHEARLREALIAAAALAIFAALVFSVGLGVPLPLWPWSD
ncbi:tripartite tricarboxylate transporter TctB family protein [Microvirga antarctica]|uniref:tripartite tricarboxylate transporter TctB family protein n=1 Tax=Microvirga antarctica TaxID=2819233 RepID=UPI001B3166CB|nr:tripartite tricarboxylate transporter TctB family protein [Microvirga antarctica]